MRLFAFLAVENTSEPQLDAWIKQAFANGRDNGNVLALALQCRDHGSLKIAAAVLARLPGVGQIESPPETNDLMHYLDRIRRQDSGKASKAADRRRPLLGLPRPSGKGAHGTRCAAAVPRVAALLNDASERARLESATEEYAQPERKRSPKKSVVKRERDAAVGEAAAATAESTRARDALSKSKKRQAGNIERAKERAADHANERIAAQVPWRFVSAPLHVSRHFVIFLHVVWC